MTIRPTTLVDHQRWKLRVALAIIAIGGVFMWFDPLVARWLAIARYLPTLIGSLTVLFALIFAVATIRCPNWGMSLAWRALSEKAAGAWLHWLTTETRCPKCGFRAGSK